MNICDRMESILIGIKPVNLNDDKLYEKRMESLKYSEELREFMIKYSLKSIDSKYHKSIVLNDNNSMTTNFL